MEYKHSEMLEIANIITDEMYRKEFYLHKNQELLLLLSPEYNAMLRHHYGYEIDFNGKIEFCSIKVIRTSDINRYSIVIKESD